MGNLVFSMKFEFITYYLEGSCSIQLSYENESDPGVLPLNDAGFNAAVGVEPTFPEK